MSDLKITVKGKPIGEYLEAQMENNFANSMLCNQHFDVGIKVQETEDAFIFTTLDRWIRETTKREVSKDELVRALYLLQEETEGRLVYTGHPHEDAIEVLTKSGWLKNHDREIYEQGQREGKPIGVGKWITKSKRNPLEEWSWRECSACGWCREDDSTANDTPYCPMCGAKMEEGD